jgi:hypothetical protein
MPPCIDDVTFEEYLLGVGSKAPAEHVRSCTNCQARLQADEKAGQHFRQFVFARTVDAVVASQIKSTPRWWFAAAAAAAVVLILSFVPTLTRLTRTEPSDDYTGSKGAGGTGSFALTVYTPLETGVAALRDGERVDAGAPLRFEVNTPEPCVLWLVSVDDNGTVSRLFPTEGDEGAPINGFQSLPGGVVLDGRAGSERFFAVCSAAPLSFSQVLSAAKEFSTLAPALPAAPKLSGLPERTLQDTLRLDKF